MEIGDLIRTARNAAGLSQRELAKQLGLAPSAVAQWEGNDTRPTNANVAAMRAIIPLDHIPPSPGSPYSGELVEDPDELALVGFWRSLTRDERGFMVKLLHLDVVAEDRKDAA